MIKWEYKIFRDNVHGYIKIPVDYVRLFIDTDIFQRLRYIEQTGMRTLYPSARHDRFIHSLGTYHLGCKAFENFKSNVEKLSCKQGDIKRKHFNVIAFDDKNLLFWDKCEVLFQIACLLHDCGHAPFSHTFELFYEHPSKIQPTLVDKLKQCLASDEFKNDFSQQGSQHERMSALVVCIEYWDKIEEILNGYKLKTPEDKNEVEFVARMIIGCQYKTDTQINRIKNCLISLLNSTSIDVDKLDYIVRDSKLSGMDNMSVDVDRLLGSLTLVEKTIFTDIRVRNASINTNILNGSLKAYNNKRATINANYIGEARINELNGQLNGSIAIKGNIRIESETSFKPANNNVLAVGGASYTHTHTIPSTSNVVDVELFGITDNQLIVSGTKIDLNKEYSGKIDMQANIFEIPAAFINGSIDGLFSGELLGYYEDLGGKLTCELGFHKSSLSVIQNVLIARNYEYQWIYSHHKVVYYSNYLLIELLRLCIKYLLVNNEKTIDEYEQIITNILSWERMVKDDNNYYSPYDFQGTSYLMPVDSDIMGIFKKCRIICHANKDITSECAKLLEEYYTRNYKKSLWKSFAEYRIFFSEFSESEKTKLQELLKQYSKPVMNLYGCFVDEWEKEFITFGMKNVIWVDAKSNLKVLNPDSTCILFKDKTLNYRTVTLDKDVQIEQELRLFYIYYEETSLPLDSTKFKSFIRDQLKSFM